MSARIDKYNKMRKVTWVINLRQEMYVDERMLEKEIRKSAREAGREIVHLLDEVGYGEVKLGRAYVTEGWSE